MPYTTNPCSALVSEPLRDLFVVARFQHYRLAFFVGGLDAYDSIPSVVVEPMALPSAQLFVEDARGEPLRACLVFVWPVAFGADPLAYVSLGRTDESGAVPGARWLSSGQYRCFILQDPAGDRCIPFGQPCWRGDHYVELGRIHISANESPIQTFRLSDPRHR